MDETFDFCGWATRNDLKCSDGRIIRQDAFKHNDGETVPLVWNHDHTDPYRVIGKVKLQNRPEGVYAYGTFNDTDLGKTAKLYVEHGDITRMSIFANQLQQQGPNVLHGAIREVSLVLAGANPGAFIENVIKHGEESEDEVIMSFGEDITLYHSNESESEDTELEHADIKKEDTMTEDTKKTDGEKTIGDVFNTLTDEQKDAVYAIIGEMIGDDDGNNEEGDAENMKHNVFDQEDTQENTLTHDAMKTIIDDGKRYGSLKESYLAHADEYGITNIDYLFPEDKNLNNPPEFIKRDTGWVSKVMNGVHHTPFSRIKSQYADITEDDARAKGYIKGNLKKEEVFSLLKRSTTPTTVYKKQKLDRDDIVDITDFDVVAWLKTEMRTMLDEELARAILIGDGRLASSDDKINEQNIRPIVTDSDLFTIKTKVTVPNSATSDDKAKAFIKAVIKSRKNYKGSGEPTLYTTEDLITDCLLIEDTTGRVIYESLEKLKNTLRVKEIVTVPVMEGVKGPNGGDLLGIVTNLADYNVGADKGGAINMFDDFDIDYNQQKYLIETRCSGALIKPYSAIELELEVSGS